MTTHLVFRLSDDMYAAVIDSVEEVLPFEVLRCEVCEVGHSATLAHQFFSSDSYAATAINCLSAPDKQP